MISSKSDQSAMSSYNSSSHDSGSSYSSNPYSSQKSVLNSSNIVPSTVSYTHTSASLNSGSSDLNSNQSQQPKYQSQVVTQGQNTSSYVSGSSSYGLQPTAYSASVTTSGNTYPSQTGKNFDILIHKLLLVSVFLVNDYFMTSGPAFDYPYKFLYVWLNFTNHCLQTHIE